MREDLIADREKHRDALRAAGRSPYPTWHGRTHVAAEIRAQYAAFARRKKPVTVAGRLLGSRAHGGVRFLDLHDASGKLQLLCRADRLAAEDYRLLSALDPGDVLAATGTVTKTRAGEVSIAVAQWTLLAKALTPLPERRAGLKDEEERARRRELDLLANEETQRVFRLRADVIDTLRAFIVRQGFAEVETPMLQHLAGGAAARPFRTHHEALDLDLTLRIAPELFLKRLIVGGQEKIFEIGRVFRNEGIDRQHNPEFTICELYQAYATVEDLIPLTERLVSTIIKRIHGTLQIIYQGTTLNFRPPWPRVTFVDAVRKTTGVDVLKERGPETYLRALRRLGAELPDDTSLPNLMDELLKEGVRKKTAGPLHLIDAPAELVPLAKRREDEPRLVQRLQVIVSGMELVNAYTEENDPVEQEARFREQARLRHRSTPSAWSGGGSGGASPKTRSEIYPFDAEYIEALKIGLPPTAGWGMGVDRLVMLAADVPSIRDVLYFPLLRPRKGSR